MWFWYCNTVCEVGVASVVIAFIVYPLVVDTQEWKLVVWPQSVVYRIVRLKSWLWMIHQNVADSKEKSGFVDVIHSSSCQGQTHVVWVLQYSL